ncbi:P-loop containing nucleoside triphosphate hydrolase protein [Lactarius psammicola]|nr:P-loop containing nucleoside triphosphate hydrolase protein [Lactarius psammicola]
MLGHGSVGKSSLLLRFTDQQWLPEHEATATIGVDTWVNTSIKLSTPLGSHKLDVKGRRVNLTVWDTPGVERFRALTSSYYRGTQGILLGTTDYPRFWPSVRLNPYAVVTVYDITNRESYGALAWWFAERSTHIPSSTVKIIIGNKVDKEHARQVPTAEAAAYAARMGCLFVETSAKTAIGVCAAFRDVVERIVETPELWAVQEPRHVSPSRTTNTARESRTDEDRSVESSEWAQIIGSITFGRNLTIRFGGPPRAVWIDNDNLEQVSDI